MIAHATQVDPEGSFFRIPLAVQQEAWPTEDFELARSLVDVGVGRLSIGVQSFDDERLRFLGRIHSGSDAVEAVRGALDGVNARVVVEPVMRQ